MSELIRYVGDERYVEVPLNGDLGTGETAQSATWTPNDLSKATYVNGSSQVSADGKSISAKFNFLAVGYVRIDIAVATTGPIEVINGYIVVNIVPKPSVV